MKAGLRCDVRFNDEEGVFDKTVFDDEFTMVKDWMITFARDHYLKLALDELVELKTDFNMTIDLTFDDEMLSAIKEEIENKMEA